MTHRFSKGDPCWICLPASLLSEPKLEKGEVVHIFNFDGTTQYVIALPSEVGAILEVREALQMASAPDGPLGR